MKPIFFVFNSNKYKTHNKHIHLKTQNLCFDCKMRLLYVYAFERIFLYKPELDIHSRTFLINKCKQCRLCVQLYTHEVKQDKLWCMVLFQSRFNDIPRHDENNTYSFISNLRYDTSIVLTQLNHRKSYIELPITLLKHVHFTLSYMSISSLADLSIHTNSSHTCCETTKFFVIVTDISLLRKFLAFLQ